METFSALLALCAVNSRASGEFPSQRPVTRSFDVFFDLRLNKRLSKQSWGRWFETPLSCSFWRHCYVLICFINHHHHNHHHHHHHHHLHHHHHHHHHRHRHHRISIIIFQIMESLGFFVRAVDQRWLIVLARVLGRWNRNAIANFLIIMITEKLSSPLIKPDDMTTTMKRG